MDAARDRHLDPLAQPTASRLFDSIVAAKHPLSTAEVAERTGVHPNSARLHLAKLLDAGMLRLESERGARGRPRKIWSVSPKARIDGEPPEAYRELATWLSRSIAAAGADRGDIRAQGRQIGREIAADSPDAGSADVLESALAAMGFQPERQDERTRTRFTLCNCPYRDVAKANPGVVCSLHLGIAEGLVQAADPAAKLTEFEVKDPIEAGCRIAIDVPPTPTTTEASG